MTVRIARIGASLTAAAALVIGVSACSAGQVTQTADTVAAVPGANLQVGEYIMMNDVMITYPGPQGYPSGGTASMILRIFNNGPDADVLKAVSVSPGEGGSPGASDVRLVNGGGAPAPSDSGSPSADASGGPVTTPGSSAINVTILPNDKQALVPGEGPYLEVSGLSGAFKPGQSLLVTFEFERAGTKQAEIPMGLPTVPGERSHAEFPEAEGEGH
ncbi:hypothetical protein [Phytomonospora endophytica]|uniref:Copper chaperone PCu(A)C n=1 Tax=Phytomonospora endophytica TaxID=714109 RepID=A0A841FJL1_9ACTN|nr:hypothetical protein [Phytomonospora endophytica]MBB6037501.1 hypothetical protein [Phytomonospora endophytica]GIG70752.1 hypothetical protein Pen01_70470 [Phytomonospora endophytica]